MSGTLALRGIHKELSVHKPGNKYVDTATLSIEMAIFYDEGTNWLLKNKKANDEAVPFDLESVMTLPLDVDGWVVPVTPELERGKWYDHDISKDKPQSPAAFIDPEEQVEWHSRDNGLEDMPIKIKDIDWSKCRRYKKYEPIDETIEGFGMF